MGFPWFSINHPLGLWGSDLINRLGMAIHGHVAEHHHIGPTVQESTTEPRLAKLPTAPRGVQAKSAELDAPSKRVAQWKSVSGGDGVG